MLCNKTVLLIILATVCNIGNGESVVSLTLSEFDLKYLYRVTHQVVQNLLWTSKQKFCFGLVRPGQAKIELVF